MKRDKNDEKVWNVLNFCADVSNYTFAIVILRFYVQF